eukprot:gene9953-22792_t
MAAAPVAAAHQQPPPPCPPDEDPWAEAERKEKEEADAAGRTKITAAVPTAAPKWTDTQKALPAGLKREGGQGIRAGMLIARGQPAILIPC